MEWFWWLIIVLVLVGAEALTANLVLFMFAGGALGASLTSLVTDNLAVQVIVFAVVSVLLVGVLRPWLLRNLRLRGTLPETNLAAQVGGTAIVVQDVTDVGGRVKFHGEVWSARSEHDEAFTLGTEVLVSRIDGATAVVERVNRPQNA